MAVMVFFLVKDVKECKIQFKKANKIKVLVKRHKYHSHRGLFWQNHITYRSLSSRNTSERIKSLSLRSEADSKRIHALDIRCCE